MNYFQGRKWYEMLEIFNKAEQLLYLSPTPGYGDQGHDIEKYFFELRDL